MLYRIQIVLFAFLALLFAACSDDDEGVEYMFDREVSELTALRQCAKGADSGSYCFMLRFHYPIDTENLESFYLWVDSTVVGDTAKDVSKSQLEKATAVFDYSKSSAGNYDTLDLTPYIQEFVKERDSLMVAVYCGYSDDKDPGSVQRTYLHFGDDIAPLFNPIARADSQWTTGAMFRWFRPTDQTDYYAPNELSGPIVGYNVIIYSEDREEDLRDLKVVVTTPEGVDSTGGKFFERQARIYRNNDSVWVDTVAHGENNKNRLRLMIRDGKGYDVDDPQSNEFRLVIEGLRPESHYMIGASAYDSSGNSAGNENVAPDSLSRFYTTDSISPLMATAIFTLKDSAYPELARLDSNNRLRIFWSRSVDPLLTTYDIKEDSVLIFPEACAEGFCYKSVESYVIDYYNTQSKGWETYSYAGGTGERYLKLYEVSGDSMEVDPRGTFVTDTIRWVIPGDTLILRIRSKDSSGYYSRPLVDTIVVSPGALASKVDCPPGFIPVSTSDSNVFCMEKFEHRDESGTFMNNVLHSEAMAACEGISASGFEVKLCGEQDWQQVCLSGGTLSYGVVEENLEEDQSATAYLFTNCNVGTNDSTGAVDFAKRNPRCVSPMGVRDMPGQFQEWVMGRSEDTLSVLKGGSYEKFGGLDRESQALCTTRSFPYFTRLAYTTDTVYLYREGTKVDTVFAADTARTPYEDKPILTRKDFKASLQFFDVQDSSGNSVGTDYALYSEYKNGGEEWLTKISGGMKYVPDHIEVVFLTGEKVAYRKAAAFYKSPSIGFRCCAYPRK